MNESVNFYDILEVSEAASPEVIRAAYQSLAKRWHPDKNLNDQETAKLKMQAINGAYAVLSDPASRKHYNDELRAERSKQRSAENESEPPKSNRPKNQEPSSGSKPNFDWIRWLIYVAVVSTTARLSFRYLGLLPTITAIAALSTWHFIGPEKRRLRLASSLGVLFAGVGAFAALYISSKPRDSPTIAMSQAPNIDSASQPQAVPAQPTNNEGSTPLTRTLQISLIMGQEECHATEKKVQRRVQA